MNTAFVGKVLIAFGIILVVTGVIFWAFGRIPLLGRMPGDIHIEGRNFTVYIPIVTCAVVSVLLSLIFWIVSRF
jgi:hypothetical protein